MASSYDPNVIIQAADEKLSNGDFEGGNMMYQSALLDWVDDAREGVSQVDPETVKEAVASLWLAYAAFLTKAKQFKSATEAYEQAVVCQIAGSNGRVWLEYARFAEDRGKLKSAQNIYIRALIGEKGNPSPIADEQDKNLLWSEFLEMMRKSNPDLTLPALQSAVHKEQQEGYSASASAEPVPSSIQSSSLVLSRKRLYDELDAGDTEMPDPAPFLTHVVTAESVDIESKAFGEGVQQKSLPPDVAAAWMVRDGNGPALPPDSPLFEPSPPKLADPVCQDYLECQKSFYISNHLTCFFISQTAKDIIGVDLALQLVERVLSPSGPMLLEVCRGLWTMHALQEKTTAEAVDMLDTTMKAEYEKLEASLESRLTVASGNVAIIAMNENARSEFQNTCGQQRQGLLTGIAWEFRNLLYIQQQILTKMKVPGFEGPTVDPSTIDLQARICSYLHSAFFIRSKVGEEPHVTMLKGHLKALQKEQKRQPSNSPMPVSFASQQQRPTMPPHPSNNYNYIVPQVPFQQQQLQQPPVMGMMGQPGYGLHPGQMHMLSNQQMQMSPLPGPYGGQQQQQYPLPPPYYHQ